MILMSAGKKTYAIFLFPRLQSVKEVQGRELNELEIPEHCFAVQFFDKVTAELVIDGTVVQTSSDRINESGRSYINATILNLDEVAAQHGRDSLIFRNMEMNKWKQAVECVGGNVQSFNKDDSVVSV